MRRPPIDQAVRAPPPRAMLQCLRMHAGTLPPELAMATTIRNINMKRLPGVSGTIPAQFGRWTNLETFELQARLSGTVPADFIAPLQRLQRLAIGGEWIRHAATARLLTRANPHPTTRPSCAQWHAARRCALHRWAAWPALPALHGLYARAREWNQRDDLELHGSEHESSFGVRGRRLRRQRHASRSIRCDDQAG